MDRVWTFYKIIVSLFRIMYLKNITGIIPHPCLYLYYSYYVFFWHKYVNNSLFMYFIPVLLYFTYFPLLLNLLNAKLNIYLLKGQRCVAFMTHNTIKKPWILNVLTIKYYLFLDIRMSVWEYILLWMYNFENHVTFKRNCKYQV